jgi:hypothetical protein
MAQMSRRSSALPRRTHEEIAALNADQRDAFLRDDREEITHGGQCLLINNKTGEPLAHFPYRVVLEDGTQITGLTNGSGYTQFVETSNQPHIKITVSP